MLNLLTRALAAAFAFLVVADAEAVQQRTGRSPGGAYYKIAAPDNWKAGDGLVFYQHGFNFDLDDSPDLGPLEELLLQQGYAVAASGYRQRGWALFTAIEDNAELLQQFTADFGAPGALYTFGGSMGGLISLKLAEDPRFAEKMKGVYAVCPPAGGAKTWNAAFDLKFAYDAVCASSGKLPQGDEPHTWALNLDDIPEDLDDPLRDSDLVDALVPVSLCTGLNFPDALETDHMRDRRARLMEIAGTTDEDTLTTLLAYAIFGTADLLRAPDKMGDRNPWHNARHSVVYPDAWRNESVPRIEKADPFAGLDFRRISSLYGTGSAKILSLHTSKDEIVVPEHQSELRALYPADRLTSALVAETEPSHCGFEAPELFAGWEALRRWSTGAAPQPTVQSLQQACTAAVGLGIAGECRLAESNTAPLATKITPRTFAPSAGIDGSWYEPERSGEGFLIEKNTALDPARHCTYPDLCGGSVSFFTYPPAGETGAQRWIIGSSKAEGDNWLVVDDARIGVTGTFGGTGVTAPWGKLEFEMYYDGSGFVRYAGPPAYGSGVRAIEQLSSIGPRYSEHVQNLLGMPRDFSRAARSGTYYDATRPGSGFVLQIDEPSEEQPTRPLIVFYTYDAIGVPLWLIGEGRYLDARTLSFDVDSTSGPRFGTAPITNRALNPWGELIVRFPNDSACTATSFEWRPAGAQAAPETRAITRLDAPVSLTRVTACRP